MVATGTFALAFWFAGREIASWFVTDAAVITLATQLLAVGALFQIVDGAQVIGAASLRAINDVKVPTLITFGAYWVVALPLGYALGVRWTPDRGRPLLHQIIWEEAHGPLPPAHVIRFRDGNRNNHDPENLFLASRNAQMLRGHLSAVARPPGGETRDVDRWGEPFQGAAERTRGADRGDFRHAEGSVRMSEDL